MRLFRCTMIWSFTCFLILLGPSVFAQVASVAGLPAPDGTANEWGNSFLWAFASSWAVRWLREHPGLSRFSENTALAAQRMVGIAVSFLNGLGITFVFDQHSGQLVIGGLFLTAISHGLRQLFFQEFVYHSAIKRPTPTSMK